MHGAPCPSRSASDGDGMPQRMRSLCSWRSVPGQGRPACPQHGCPRPCRASWCARSGRLEGFPSRGGGAERPPSCVGGCLSASEKCLSQFSACFSASSCLSVMAAVRLLTQPGWSPCPARVVHTFPPVPGLPFPSDGGFFGFREVLKLNVAHPVSAACPVRSVLRSDAFSLPWCPLSLPCLASAWFACLHQDCLSNSPSRGFGS